MAKRGEVVGKTPFGEARKYTEKELQEIAVENVEAAKEKPAPRPKYIQAWQSVNGWRVELATGLLYPPEGDTPAKYEFTFDVGAIAAGMNPIAHATQETAQRIHKVIQRLVADRVVTLRKVSEFFMYPHWEIVIQGSDPVNAGAQAFDLILSGYQWFFLKFRDQCRRSGVEVNALTEEEALKGI